MPTIRPSKAQRLADIHVSHLSREKNSPDARCGGACKNRYLQDSQFATCASRRWFLPSKNRTSICCLGPRGPSQKIEFVFSASPETIRREPREFQLLRSVGHLQDPAVCAPFDPVIFSLPPQRFKLPPCFAL